MKNTVLALALAAASLPLTFAQVAPPANPSASNAPAATTTAKTKKSKVKKSHVKKPKATTGAAASTGSTAK